MAITEQLIASSRSGSRAGSRPGSRMGSGVYDVSGVGSRAGSRGASVVGIAAGSRVNRSTKSP